MSNDAWRKLVKSLDNEIDGLLENLCEHLGIEWLDEYRFVRKDGESVQVSDLGHLIRNPEGRPIRMIGGMSDITGRKRAEEQITQQAALIDEARDAVLAHVQRQGRDGDVAQHDARAGVLRRRVGAVVALRRDVDAHDVRFLQGLEVSWVALPAAELRGSHVGRILEEVEGLLRDEAQLAEVGPDGAGLHREALRRVAQHASRHEVADLQLLQQNVRAERLQEDPYGAQSQRPSDESEALYRRAHRDQHEALGYLRASGEREASQVQGDVVG